MWKSLRQTFVPYFVWGPRRVEQSAKRNNTKLVKIHETSSLIWMEATSQPPEGRQNQADTNRHRAGKNWRSQKWSNKEQSQPGWKSGWPKHGKTIDTYTRPENGTTKIKEETQIKKINTDMTVGSYLTSLDRKDRNHDTINPLLQSKANSILFINYTIQTVPRLHQN